MIRSRIARRAAVGLGLGAIGLVAAVACSPAQSGGQQVVAEASCAHVIVFRGERYFGRNATVHPSVGEPLGEATVPACNDQPNGPTDTDERIFVAGLPDVDPEVAIVAADTPEVVFIREGVLPLPAAVERLFSAPKCERPDESIEMSGTWLGIIGADGNTELDLMPPYDVELLVLSSSEPRFTNAELVVRVPADLGTPLDRDDIRRSLWEGRVHQRGRIMSRRAIRG